MATARDGGRSGKAAAKRVARSKSLRSRQDLLPVTVTELETLKQLPLQRWDDRQRTLLNMTFRPWALTATDSSCRRMATRFSAGLRPTALVSLPSSGNTWLRQLIEGATGVFTGSPVLGRGAHQGRHVREIVPYDSGTTIAQKTHGFTTLEGVTAEPEQQRRVFSHVTQFGCRAVLLVRNPLAALLSHRHLDAAGHLGFAPPSHFEGEGWQEYVSEKALFWRKLYADWIGQCPTDQLLLVRYERLLEDLPTELGRVLRFLGVRPDPARLRCLYRRNEGP
ncbi:WSC domain-containing protein 2-like [Pollicipes pollicipes]|uniref:WSC domain-containing protein 2-like n=1 Tax=Pollicipes pollicipes TaxID=41117 RepID=UPI0018851CB1|nr:WSC domain-containing protein 2-like [Pollicipes pollicipes]